MINLLINSFVPVAILILIGYISAKKSIFSKENSIAIIKYVGVIAVPALTLKIILSISISNVNWTLIFSYVFSELIIYVTALLIGKYIFNLKWNEAILIGMASSFANHLLFVYPIALNEYEADLIHPIVAIIGFDVIFLVINLIILDLIKFKNLKLKNIFIKQFSNLPLLALILGITIIFLDIEVPISIDRALDFIANSAAPCALFAAGIILSQKLEKTEMKISNLIIDSPIDSQLRHVTMEYPFLHSDYLGNITNDSNLSTSYKTLSYVTSISNQDYDKNLNGTIDFQYKINEMWWDNFWSTDCKSSISK